MNLTLQEKIRYNELKQKCKSAWIDFATAILEIRERKLYLVEHSTFEAFCTNELKIDDSTARRLMSGAKVLQNLSTVPIGTIPQTESQARPLAKLEPELQRETWAEVIEENQTITAKIVAEKVATKTDLNQALKEVKRENQPNTIFVQTPLTEKEIIKKAKELKEERKQAYKAKMQKRIEDKAKQPLTQEEQVLLASAQAGETTVININKHFAVLKWAKDNGQYQQIDRYSEWGNPFHLETDGTRAEVCDAYEKHYLPYKKGLFKKVDSLKGKVLGCHCAPLQCHGHGIVNIINSKNND
jgi:hypothetical protein